MKLCLLCGQQFVAEGWECPSCSYVPEMEAGHYAFVLEKETHDDGFDPGYFNKLAGVEDKNWWFQSRNRLIVWALQRYFPRINTFLEVGCGTGFILSGIQKAFPHLSLSGGELFMEGIACAAHRLPHASFFQMDCRRIPFEEEFDVVGSFDVLEHIDEDEEVLAQIFRATRKGGGIMLTVPQHPFLWSDWDKCSFHKRRYTRKGIIRKVENAGFRVAGCFSFVSILLPLMLLDRIGRNRKQDTPDLFKRMGVRSSLNRTLSRIMSVEIFMIRTGISLPLGGSLLLAGRKM